MDPSLVLDQTLQDVSNLPAEFRYSLEEIAAADEECLDLKKKYQQKEVLLHKYIKQNGSLKVNPKEEELTAEIHELMERIKEIQEEKCKRANTILFLVSRHLAKLEKNTSILEEDGLLAPAEEEMDSGTDYSRESSVFGSGLLERKRKAPMDENGGARKKKQGRSMSSTQRERKKSNRGSSAAAGATPADDAQDVKSPGSTERDGTLDLQNYQEELFSSMNENENEDQNLYCFCQRVSFGEMVACDGPNCKYEWFHYECVNLKEPPKGTWYCPDCQQEMAKKNKKKK
ncbi:Chromatin modification-related protein YNG2 [Nakaseomyces bracarensis]|uniref:Chromatin modification-related protein n=1 Tax=Nakaseomyces bracarensis TaxID=273131 RepID=A0ABR4NTS3_9SACH